MNKVYLNGQIIDANNAKIRCDDRGFRYGDGVFETIKVQNSIPLLWNAHMRRLQDGLDAIYISLSVDFLAQVVRKLIKNNLAVDCFVRIAVSRGIGSNGYMPMPFLNQTPTVFVELLPCSLQDKKPLKLIFSKYQKISPASLPTHAKIAQGLQSTLARIEAYEAGVDDVILLDEKGNVSETSSANIFWLKDKNIFTPSLASGALAGVMRESVIACGYAAVQQILCKKDEILAADAVFLTNVRFGICAVEEIAGIKFQTTHAIFSELAAVLEGYIKNESSNWRVDGKS